ncbi:hypothetical protein F5148DRAFT_1225543 [Russula earlei]|uniref:Uncharacterized protein n=1 Tax=Russula earlei TaxID=71964 RepID=A0ACC0U1W5_9AGAM|nr:hypothetical protein F5148DRAFT_1225543 [Russula earlei]
MMGRNVCFLAAASSVSCVLPFSLFLSSFLCTSKPHIPASPASESRVQFPQVSLASFLPGAVFFFFFPSHAAVTTTMSLSQWQPQRDGHNHDRDHQMAQAATASVPAR